MSRSGPERATILRMAIDNDDSEEGFYLMTAMSQIHRGLQKYDGGNNRRGLSEAAAAEFLWALGKLMGGDGA